MISTVEKNEVNPICPHSKSEIREIWFQKLKDDLGKRCIIHAGRNGIVM
jgi:hypothetical protein